MISPELYILSDGSQRTAVGFDRQRVFLIEDMNGNFGCRTEVMKLTEWSKLGPVHHRSYNLLELVEIYLKQHYAKNFSAVFSQKSINISKNSTDNNILNRLYSEATTTIIATPDGISMNAITIVDYGWYEQDFEINTYEDVINAINVAISQQKILTDDVDHMFGLFQIAFSGVCVGDDNEIELYSNSFSISNINKVNNIAGCTVYNIEIDNASLTTTIVKSWVRGSPKIATFSFSNPNIAEDIKKYVMDGTCDTKI